MIPNFKANVESCKNKFPEAWKNAHTGNSMTHDFIRIVAADIHKADKRFGLVGQYGNPNDLAEDALCFAGSGIGFDPTNGDAPVTVIDIISDAGGDNPQPAWQVLDDPNIPSHSGPAAWVQPAAGEIPEPGPEPVPPVELNFPPRDANGRFFQRLDDYYRDHGRPNRCETGEPLHVDNEGLFVWPNEFTRHYLTNGNDEQAASDSAMADVEAAWPKDAAEERRVADVSTLSAEEAESLALIEELGGVDERRGEKGDGE